MTETKQSMTLEDVRDWMRRLEKQHDLVPPLREAYGSAADAIDAHLSAQRKCVGDSNFEWWYADEFKPRNKEEKQRMREAYEAGMNDLSAQREGVAAAFEQECNDVDQILRKLGLDPEKVRTECGYLIVPRILNHIQETLDALIQATNFGAAMNDKYCAYVKAHPPHPRM
jgi:hypothetical protein